MHAAKPEAGQTDIAAQDELTQQPTFIRDGKPLSAQVHVDMFDAAHSESISRKDMNYWFTEGDDDFETPEVLPNLEEKSVADFTTVNPTFDVVCPVCVTGMTFQRRHQHCASSIAPHVAATALRSCNSCSCHWSTEHSVLVLVYSRLSRRCESGK